nr:hypothetical protein [Tanacetum cinerariifolium]
GSVKGMAATAGETSGGGWGDVGGDDKGVVVGGEAKQTLPITRQHQTNTPLRAVGSQTNTPLRAVGSQTNTPLRAVGSQTNTPLRAVGSQTNTP